MKRIGIIKGIIAIALCVALLPVSAVNVEAKAKKTTTAKKNFTIYADAGHGCIYTTSQTKGPYGFAAIGAAGEAAYTNAFTQYYIQATNMGSTSKAVPITSLSLNGVQGSTQLFGNSGRSDLFAASGCDAMIQFHYDKITPDSTTGAHVIYSNNSANSIYLAYCIATAMSEAGLRMNSYYPMYISERHELSCYKNALNKPLVLIELGMGVPGETDSDYLRDPATIQKLVTAVNTGVSNYRTLLNL